MRYEQIEKFISEGGDLEDLIIDQEPLHDADHTFSYYYLRKGAVVPIRDFKDCDIRSGRYWSVYWNQKKGKEISYD